MLSDRTAKTDFEAVDVAQVLDRVAALPMQTWRYRTEAADVRHLGPMAQDFRAAFGLGDDERRITTVDLDGVALAAIQGLHAQNEALRAELDEVKAEQAAQRELLDQLQQRLADLEDRLGRD